MQLCCAPSRSSAVPPRRSTRSQLRRARSRLRENSRMHGVKTPRPDRLQGVEANALRHETRADGVQGQRRGTVEVQQIAQASAMVLHSLHAYTQPLRNILIAVAERHRAQHLELTLAEIRCRIVADLRLLASAAPPRGAERLTHVTPAGRHFAKCRQQLGAPTIFPQVATRPGFRGPVRALLVANCA